MQTQIIEESIKSQIEVSSKLKSLSCDRLLAFGVAGLNEEAGEVSGLICREIYKQDYQSEEEWLGELGDVLWYLTCVIVARGLTFDEIYRYNMNKLSRRYGLESKEVSI